jgi:hypothetical protein
VEQDLDRGQSLELADKFLEDGRDAVAALVEEYGNA